MIRGGMPVKDTISHTQLTALVWAGVLAPAAELLPVLTLPVAGKGAWLAPAAAIPLVLLSGWLLGSLAGERGLASGLRGGLGPVLGSGTLLIYMMWGELLLALRLRLAAQRLLDSGCRDGAMWFFLLGIAALVLWMGLGKLSAFARAGQVFLALLLTAAGVVLALSLSQIRLERTLPLWKEDILPVLSSALPAAGVLGWGIWGAFLTDHVEGAKERDPWYLPFWGVGGCLLLALAQWITLSNLGPTLAARLDDPFFTLAKSVGVEGAFQRVESVFAALWTFADLTMAALLLFAVRSIIRTLAPGFAERRTALAALGLAVVLALTVFPDGRADRWNRALVPAGNLILGSGVPLILWFLRGMTKRRKNKHISCGEDSP